MDIAIIRKTLADRPFRPFVMRLNDGREFAVKHPEWVFLDKRDVLIVDDEDTWIHLEPILIASLTIKRPAGAAPA